MDSRRFLLKFETGLFLLAISKTGRHFTGLVRYYVKSSAWGPTFWYDEHFLDDSHEKVCVAALGWVSENLGTSYTVEEI